MSSTGEVRSYLERYAQWASDRAVMDEPATIDDYLEQLESERVQDILARARELLSDESMVAMENAYAALVAPTLFERQAVATVRHVHSILRGPQAVTA